MEVVVLVPRRSGDPWREQLWKVVRERWACIGWEGSSPWRLVEGHHLKGPFNRSAAVNKAATQAGAWDVAVIADADTLVDAGQARRAVELASKTGRIVIAHDEYVALNQVSTRRYLERRRLLPQARWVMSNSVSGCLAVPRALWELVGGFDQRFNGWGWEDRAFFIACDTLGGGHERVHAPVFHLWHRRSPERNRELPNYVAGHELVSRYKAADGDAPAIKALLEERFA